MWNVCFSMNVATVSKGLAAQAVLIPGGLVIRVKEKLYLAKDFDDGKLTLDPIEAKDQFTLFKQQSSSLELCLEDLNQPDFIQYRAFKVGEESLKKGMPQALSLPLHLKVNLQTDSLQKTLKTAKKTGELRIHVDVQLGDSKSSYTQASIRVVDAYATEAHEPVYDRVSVCELLREMIDVSIPNLMHQYSFGKHLLDEKKYIEALIHLHRHCEESIQKLQVDHVAPEPDFSHLLDDYTAVMQQAAQHEECIQRHNDKLLSCAPLVDRILALIRNDNAKKLQLFIKNLEKAPGIELYNRALRVAAEGGCINCLTYLLSAEFPNILDPGPESSKIALHFAIENAHLNCIKALLQGTNMNGFYDPAGQLLYGEMPHRPIDAINLIEDRGIQNDIIQLISSILESNAGLNTSKDQLTEIEEFIEAHELNASLLSF